MKRVMTLFPALLLLACAGCGKESVEDADQDRGATPPPALDEAPPADAEGVMLRKNGRAPVIRGRDIHDADVDMAQLLAGNPRVLVQLFFSPAGGRELAGRLKLVNDRYGEDIKVLAVGFEEDRDELVRFARSYDIGYHVLNETDLADASWTKQLDKLPVTVFVAPTEERTIVKLVRGGGETKANVIKEVALILMQQGAYDMAEEAAEMSLRSGEDEREAHETKGFIFTAQGKLDDAESEFGRVESQAGLARVALERGDPDKALELASATREEYAQTVKAKALMQKGDLDAAQAAAAAARPREDWQQSETATIEGRILQEKGDAEGAVARYEEASDMSYYNIVPLSNQASLFREKGELDKAATVLEEAKRRGTDDMVVMMLRQVRDEMRAANDAARREQVRKQIASLAERYRELKERGELEPVDPWTSRPLVVAFLPSSDSSRVFFERAGMDTVLQRELERSLQATDGVQVVERQMLDTLLQELDLGSSDLADKETQLRLGNVLSARLLGFIDFAQLGGDILMYVRLVDTETTSIEAQLSRQLGSGTGLVRAVSGLSDEIVADLLGKHRLQGLIGDAEEEDNVVINLGEIHGLKPGRRFAILNEGDPITVGGKTIGNKEVPVGVLEVKEVQPEMAVARVVQKEEGAVVENGTRIRELPKS